MRLKKAPNELKSIKLFFELGEDSKELTFPLMCKVIREKLNISQLELANKLKVPIVTYKGWEQGKREPNGKAAINLFVIYIQSLQIKEDEAQSVNLELVNSLEKGIPLNNNKIQIADPQNLSL